MPFLQHLIICTALLCTNLQASRIKASRKARALNSVDELDGVQTARSGDAAPQEHFLCDTWFPNGCKKTSSRKNAMQRKQCPKTCADMQPEASELQDPMQKIVEATTGEGGEEYCKTLGLTKCTDQQATACPEWCKDKPRVKVVAPKATASTVNNVNEDVPAWRSGLTTHVDKEHKGTTAVKVNADLPAICAELLAKKKAGNKASCNDVAKRLCDKAQEGFCAALAE